VDWFNNMLQCRKQNTPNCQLVAVDRAAYDTIGTSDAKLLLSPSCKQCLSDWHRISLICIEKQQTTQVVGFVFSSCHLYVITVSS